MKIKILVFGLSILTFCYSCMTAAKTPSVDIDAWLVNKYNKALADNPYYSTAKRNAATAGAALLAIRGKDMQVFTPEFDSAISYFAQAIESDPGYIIPYISMGMLYDSSGNYIVALEYYNKALKINDKYTDVLNNMGITYFNLGDYPTAEKYFLRTVNLNPKYPYPLNNLGFLYLKLDKIDDSISYFKKSIDLNYDNPFLKGESAAGLACCYYLKGDEKTAGLYKKEALRLNPSLVSLDYLKRELSWDDSVIEIFFKKIKITLLKEKIP
jgi:tetratricopeptide (TPR) repeat protein